MRLLLVEDDHMLRDLLVALLQEDDYQVTACGDGAKAWDIFRRTPFPLVVTDWNLPGQTGLDLCRQIRNLPESDTTFIIVITANRQISHLKQVLAAGADDFISKPFDLELFQIRLTIAATQAENLARKHEAETKLQALRRQLTQQSRFHDFIGKSKPMRAVYQLIQDLARVDATVLINGETGTGKELVARAIHGEGDRRSGPFITVNCGGLSESLIASQLFGHRKGAFTGAISDQQGVFEAADGGTLFLDEIGDLPLNLQTSFLRVLESRTITRIGEAHQRKVDVRVVAATHHELTHLVNEGQFREDLMYRIRVGRVHLPPLRERREDIPLLVNHFLQEMGNDRKRVKGAGDDTLAQLMSYPWPGNVRELRNAVEFAFIRCHETWISIADLPPELQNTWTPTPQKKVTTDKATSLKEAVKICGGNHSQAARYLGISRATYYRWLKEARDKGELA
ncbi:Sigma-54-dependent Fis family transcriptional regulator [Sulfidibacter corallicola]|uniref:Sigma-54-dependent Fis family transcriptional regulator n=1 Tax=Sulfidibacter corallicola TaxID=2818388 RepID=A0A8A4TLG4_SULCO|nr:sigma-54 dependent transcriptional regulator [Sulfidibacter corallicola]QTD49708.1 sigma-54-dependent Fis family transcriptional regulator [Sulfidibacter corallicola]